MVKSAIKPKKGKPKAKGTPGKVPGLLTEKQAEFARQIVAGKNQTDAYRLAYLPREDSKPETLAILAHRIARRPAVGAYVAKLRARVDRGVLLSLNDRLKILSGRILNPEAKDSDVAQLTAVYSRISGDQAPERVEHDVNVAPLTEVSGPLVRRLSARERLEQLRAARRAGSIPAEVRAIG